ERLCDRAGTGVEEAARASATSGCGGSTSGGVPRFGAAGDFVRGGATRGDDWKASAMTMNGAGLDAGEGNPGSVIILQKRLGVGTATIASSVGRGWPVCASSPAVVSVRSWSSGIRRNLGVRLGKSVAGLVERGSEGGSTGAYIVGVVDHPYLATWLPLWLTMLSHTSTMPAVLAVGHASAGKGVGLTCVSPTVRPLASPYLRPASFPHRVGHVGGPVV
ncbi:hypothetical protein BHE74_00026459, partial [Ensete ventricosum]